MASFRKKVVSSDPIVRRRVVTSNLRGFNVHFVTSRSANEEYGVWVRSAQFFRPPSAFLCLSMVASFAEFRTTLAYLVAPQNQYKHDRWLRSAFFRARRWLCCHVSRPRSLALSGGRIGRNIIGGFVRRFRTPRRPRAQHPPAPANKQPVTDNQPLTPDNGPLTTDN